MTEVATRKGVGPAEAAQTSLPAWRALVPGRVSSEQDAAAFVHTLGFCTWGPVPGLPFPNLAEQMGESGYSVLFHTWFWKDDLHFERALYYAKVVRGQPTFISPQYVPDFVAALSGRGHEREREPGALFAEGRLSRQAKLIYDYLHSHPAQPTRDLRRGTGLFTKDQSTATEKALMELQRRFLVCKVGLTGRTRGTYSYIWDLTERFCPDVFGEAGRTSVHAARSRIRSRLDAFGIVPSPALEQRLFLWRP